MKTQHVLSLAAPLLLLSACATTPGRPALSEFPDIPMVESMAYSPERSTIIESPKVKAARFVYKGRIEPESLGNEMRKGLEANGWKTVSSTTASRGSITQIYEKGSSTTQVLIWEGSWNTYLEVTTARVNDGTIPVAPVTAPAPGPGAAQVLK
jgi:hypothetical protein